MTKSETTKARRILADRIASSEVVRDGKTYGLSVTWTDGSGQKIFWALDAVEEHTDERRGGPRKGAGRKAHTDPHTVTLAIACSQTEKARWQALAKKARASVSEWVRRHLP